MLFGLMALAALVGYGVLWLIDWRDTKARQRFFKAREYQRAKYFWHLQKAVRVNKTRKHLFIVR